MDSQTQADTPAFVEAAADFWRSRRSSLTAVRKILCEVLGEAREPVDAEEVLARAKQVDRLISLSTVY